MLKNQLVILLLALCFLSANAQPEGSFSIVKLPAVIPPSPEVASLGKIGSLSAGLHTGSANVSIPLYELGLNGFKLPIMLSYSSNGVKVDEIPGRVGMGWNLVAGGVVSRIVHDEPDGTGTKLAPPLTPGVKDAALLSYLKSSADFELDTEQDEYSYSFNGQSGKFFVDSLGIGHCIPHNTNKIIVNGFNQNSKSVTIITPDGTRYDFGGYGATEKTRSITVSGVATKQAYFEMAWFLTKITTNKGEVINFTYSPIFIRTKQGNFQTVTKPSMPVASQNCTTGALSCSSLATDNKGVSLLDYDTYYLSSISATNSVNIAFSYDLRPDSAGDNRLKDMYVYTSGAGFSNPIKRYGFEYADPTIQNGFNPQNRRFYLTKIKSYDLQSGNEQQPYQSWIEHTIEYNDINGLRERLSFAQDYFGYYNGQDGNDQSLYFIPLTTGLENYWNGNAGVNRTPNGTYGQKGLLKKVKYPTGGTDEFIYEPNTISRYNSATSTSQATIGGSGLSTLSPQVFTTTITANSTHQATISLSSYKSPAFPNAPGGEGNLIYEFKLTNLTTGASTFYRKYFYYTSESFTVSLINANQYQLQVTCWGQENAGNATLQYNPNVTSSFVNDDVGGLRVKEIRSYDPLSNKSSSKYYNYAALADLTKSSGVGVSRTANIEFVNSGLLCTVSGFAFSIISCPTAVISANSSTPFYSFGGSQVAYASVLESDDPNFKNGCVEHLFTTNLPANSAIAFVGSVPGNVPLASAPDLNGQEYATRYYKKTSSGLLIQKEIKNYYTEDFRVFNSISNYITRRRWPYPASHTPIWAEEWDCFDLVRYELKSWFVRLDSTVTIDYDNNGLNPITTRAGYEYANITHFNPTKIVASSSDNGLISTQNKYPIDFASGTNAYQRLVDMNNISPVIETKSFKGATELTTVKTDYNYSFAGINMLAPEIMKTQKTSSGPLESRIHFYRYDAGGNVLEVSKEGGMRISYIYDYANNLPIGEFKNASLSSDSIAYTSFEVPGKGYWNFSFNPTQDFSAPTGTQCHNLSIFGSITRTVNSAKTYYITYWLKNGTGTATVNGLAGTVLTAKNGWTCYRNQVSGTTLVTVAGSAMIDELRLFPVGALVTTYAYLPYVGISSACLPSNQLMQYEYDGYNRLKLVRDGDRNIMKQYAYAYNQSYTPCSTVTPNWVITGNQRCVQSGVNNNYTGQKEREEKDMNNCSPTYQQIRWVSITPGCTQTFCSGEGWRIPTGGSTCVQGQQIMIYQTYSNGVWECKYYYYWPQDGYRSPDIISYDVNICGVS